MPIQIVRESGVLGLASSNSSKIWRMRGSIWMVEFE
jgi:hypothetical protein